MQWHGSAEVILLRAEQDPKGAKQSFVICLDLDPNHGPALANLTVLLDRLGEIDGAVEIADRALLFQSSPLSQDHG